MLTATLTVLVNVNQALSTFQPVYLAPVLPHARSMRTSDTQICLAKCGETSWTVHRYSRVIRELVGPSGARVKNVVVKRVRRF